MNPLRTSLGNTPLGALLLAGLLGSSLAWAADAPAKPIAGLSKAELISRITEHQRSLADSLANSVVQGPMAPLITATRAAMQQVPPEKREATAKALEAELRKFVDENVGYLREKALQALPGTSGAILEERFNEDELREILTWMEAPVNRKFGTALGETQKRLAEKVVPEAGPTLEARFRVLQTSVAKLLGLPPPGAARPANAPPAPPAPASAAQPKK